MMGFKFIQKIRTKILQNQIIVNFRIFDRNTI